MITEPFLRKELIDTDLANFAKGLSTKIPNSEVSVYEDMLMADTARLGFTVVVNGDVYQVYMYYAINDRQEYAIKNKKWEICKQGRVVALDLPSLQEVIDYINTPRKNYINLFGKVTKLDGQLQEIINGLDKVEDKEVIDSLMNVYKSFLDAEATIWKLGGRE